MRRSRNTMAPSMLANLVLLSHLYKLTANLREFHAKKKTHKTACPSTRICIGLNE